MKKLILVCGIIALFLAPVEAYRRGEKGTSLKKKSKDPYHVSRPEITVSILKAESCDKPSGPGNQLTVHYTVFDTSIGKSPFSFVLGAKQVIEGWEKGMLGACEGEQRRLKIPYQMAYGEKGFGKSIPRYN
ncbi:hypothetical protein PROFUN_13995 [Planoprotostelium fungivorum]|uniref:peptidylprolyl isomerase n=1 Tax=Planoprotostelium fungivorum TaxID=1890364 RepID=A0A2P6N2M3_9EUKA|nr:hypothetical protein PROFUN_13995 [Planoprotostelium fungivorum]